MLAVIAGCIAQLKLKYPGAVIVMVVASVASTTDVDPSSTQTLESG